MQKRAKKSFVSNSRNVIWALLIVAVAVTVYGVAEAATVSHRGEDIEPPIDATTLQGLSAADILAAGGGACVVSGNNIVCSGIPNSTAGTLAIAKNGVTCPIWKDCDGDGRTYGRDDCDESCPTCFVGSVGGTSVPDGLDQNCNQLIDENVYSPWFIPSCATGSSITKYGSTCGAAEDASDCTRICTDLDYQYSSVISCIPNSEALWPRSECWDLTWGTSASSHLGWRVFICGCRNDFFK